MNDTKPAHRPKARRPADGQRGMTEAGSAGDAQHQSILRDGRGRYVWAFCIHRAQ